jgi:hypothetical protein
MSKRSAQNDDHADIRAAVRALCAKFPGETIRTEIWRDGGIASFRARVVEREVIAINNGRAEVR